MTVLVPMPCGRPDHTPHARQFKRAKKEIRRLKTYLGRVYRDILRNILDDPDLHAQFHEELALTERMPDQQKQDKNKLYSIHAPEVECIAKGKVHKKYEFGVKVSVATTSRDNFVVGMQALPGNPFDGHMLAGAIEQVSRLTGVVPVSLNAVMLTVDIVATGWSRLRFLSQGNGAG